MSCWTATCRTAAVVLYWIAQKVLYYFMTKVYLYLHPQGAIAPGYLIAVAALDVLLCAGAMTLAGRKMLREQEI